MYCWRISWIKLLWKTLGKNIKRVWNKRKVNIKGKLERLPRDCRIIIRNHFNMMHSWKNIQHSKLHIMIYRKIFLRASRLMMELIIFGKLKKLNIIISIYLWNNLEDSEGLVDWLFKEILFFYYIYTYFDLLFFLAFYK